MFLYYCDPRQRTNSKRQLALINFYSLFTPELLIQDNFIISKSFIDVINISYNKSLYTLFESGILKIAFRDGVNTSLISLLQNLSEKSKLEEYIPFEGPEGIELYQNKTFNDYLSTIDNSIPYKYKANFLWNQDELGILLKYRLKNSINNNTLKLETSLAQEIFNRVEESYKTISLKHKRSDYYKVINSIADNDTKQIIKTWVDENYLFNIPDYLNVGCSFDSNTFMASLINDPYRELLLLRPQADISQCLDTFIFLEEFLVNLDSESIIKLRELPEFKDFILSLKENRNVLGSFINYVNCLTEEAPKYYGRYKELYKNETCSVITINKTNNILKVIPGAESLLGFVSILLNYFKKNKESKSTDILRQSKSELTKMQYSNKSDWILHSYSLNDNNLP